MYFAYSAEVIESGESTAKKEFQEWASKFTDCAGEVQTGDRWRANVSTKSKTVDGKHQIQAVVTVCVLDHENHCQRKTFATKFLWKTHPHAPTLRGRAINEANRWIEEETGKSYAMHV
jgi:hypothetical protein